MTLRNRKTNNLDFKINNMLKLNKKQKIKKKKV